MRPWEIGVAGNAAASKFKERIFIRLSARVNLTQIPDHHRLPHPHKWLEAKSDSLRLVQETHKSLFW